MPPFMLVEFRREGGAPPVMVVLTELLGNAVALTALESCEGLVLLSLGSRPRTLFALSSVDVGVDGNAPGMVGVVGCDDKGPPPGVGARPSSFSSASSRGGVDGGEGMSVPAVREKSFANSRDGSW